MRIQRFLALSLISASVAGLIACEPVKKIDKMSDTTARVADTTERMADTTEALTETTVDMRENMETLRSDMSDGFSSEFLENRIREMRAANDPTEKLRIATLFFSQMPMQVWTGQGADNQQRREQLFYGAVRMTLGFVATLVDDRQLINDHLMTLGNDTLRNDDWLSLASLSIAMSTIYVTQSDLARANHFEAKSVYDLITHVLSNAQTYEQQGTNAPMWVREVLSNESEALYLIRLRYAYFPSVVLTRISNIEDRFGGVHVNFIHHAIFGWTGLGWDLKLTHVTDGEFNGLNELMDKYKHTKEWLQSRQDPMTENVWIRRVVQGIRWKDAQPIRFAPPTIGEDRTVTYSRAGDRFLDNMKLLMGVERNVRRQ